jgi:hypothetical protein
MPTCIGTLLVTPQGELAPSNACSATGDIVEAVGQAAREPIGGVILFDTEVTQESEDTSADPLLSDDALPFRQNRLNGINALQIQ